jgi:hypothetical protein
MREPGDYLRHGDYEPWGEHGVRLIAPKTCYRDHPVTGSSGFGECPRCGVPTNVWWCGNRDCDGKRTSKAHERDCPLPLQQGEDQSAS